MSFCFYNQHESKTLISAVCFQQSKEHFTDGLLLNRISLEFFINSSASKNDDLVIRCKLAGDIKFANLIAKSSLRNRICIHERNCILLRRSDD